MSEQNRMSNHEYISNYYQQHRDEIVSFIAVRILSPKGGSTMRKADADEAQDMVQDLFLRLLDTDSLITPQTLPALVYTMARHRVADYFRRRRVFEEYEHFLINTDSIGEIESLISARLLMERLEQSMTVLSESCARIYRLHIYDGLKVSEIAQQLSLPYKQVENRLGKARRLVRQQFRACV